MAKKGMELSINFLVLLIVALVVFGLSLSLMYKIYAGANSLSSQTQDKLDNQITSLVCSTEQVCVETSSKVINRGEWKVLGVQVTNRFKEEKKFKITVTGDQLKILPEETEFTLKATATKRHGIGIEVPKDMVSGTKIVNVEVKYYNDTNFVSYGENDKYKMYVKVP